jgi:hypothetical protein
MGEGATPVLKISVLDTPKRRRLMLEGRLVGPWTVELKSAFEKAKSGLQNRELVIDLRCLTAISEEGETALVELLGQGVKFHSSGVFTKLVMKQLTEKNCQEKK